MGPHVIGLLRVEAVDMEREAAEKAEAEAAAEAAKDETGKK